MSYIISPAGTQGGMTIPPGLAEFRPHPGQMRVLTSIARFILVVAGTQGGKTICVPTWLYDEIALRGPGDYLIVSPTYDIAKKTVIPQFLKQWRDTCLGMPYGRAYAKHYNRPDLETKWKSSDKVYEIPLYGVNVYFRSAEIPESLQGGAYLAAVFDECGQEKSIDAFHAIQQRLSIARGRCLLCSTPYGHEWFRDLIIKAKSGDPEYAYINWKSIDNPYFPAEEYYARQKEWPRYLFNMYYNGEYGIPEHAIFPEFSDANITEVIYDPTKPIYVMCDFNVSPLHWVLGQQFGDRLDIYDEIYLPYSAKTQDALNELWDRHATHTGQFVFFGDASSKSEHTSAAQTDYVQIYNDVRFIKAGRHFRWPAANPSQRARCDATAAKIKSASGDIRLLISPRCKYLIKDIQSLTWIKGSHQIDKKAYDGHGADALMYCVYQVWPLVIKPVVASSGIFTVASTARYSMKDRMAR